MPCCRGAALGGCFTPHPAARPASSGGQRTSRTVHSTVAASGPHLGQCHPPQVPGRLPTGGIRDRNGPARHGGAQRGLRRLHARQACEAPAPERVHAGVWVCHSLVSKLISGSLTRGIKSRSRNGIHSSSCPGGEQARRCLSGLGQGKAAGGPAPSQGTLPAPRYSLQRDPTGTGGMFLPASTQGCAEWRVPGDLSHVRGGNQGHQSGLNPPRVIWGPVVPDSSHSSRKEKGKLRQAVVLGKGRSWQQGQG